MKQKLSMILLLFLLLQSLLTAIGEVSATTAVPVAGTDERTDGKTFSSPSGGFCLPIYHGDDGDGGENLLTV